MHRPNGRCNLSGSGLSSRQRPEVRRRPAEKPERCVIPSLNWQTMADATGTGFFWAETTPRKMPTACRGTEKRKGNDKKARQWRANVASLHKVPDNQTGWWVRQGSNL